ncbi:MAG: hypothetical protein WC846_01665 [Candidatus Gracilibacteria bacterium]|jgi:hypothetical protein
MDAFRGLSQKTKMLIILSAMFLFTLSVGVLVFGANNLTPENSFVEQAISGSRADMLYNSLPTEEE